MHGTNVLFTVEFVAQQADGEGAGPVDDLPAVGTALFEDGGRPVWGCLLYTSPSPRDGLLSRMPSSA